MTLFKSLHEREYLYSVHKKYNKTTTNKTVIDSSAEKQKHDTREHFICYRLRQQIRKLFFASTMS